ncbi:cysteine synthase [Saccharopolyspora erythraea D]|nr:cysteine synthase [Saccharopolyspora erythraea D]
MLGANRDTGEVMNADAVDAPWKPDLDYSLDVDAVTGRFPAMADFRRKLGGTRLVEVPVPAGSARVLAKAEWENPCGSIKDRTAFALLCEVLADCDDPRGLHLVEYSGGNLAAPLSVLCGRLGVRLTLVLSEATPGDYVDELRSRGAAVDLVDREEGFLGVMERARELSGTGRLLYQHRSQANLWMHRISTGAEVVEQLGEAVPDRFVASVGTGGTLVGVLSALGERHPGVRGVVVTPSELPYGSDEPPNGRPKYAGSGGLGNGIRQPFVLGAVDRMDGYRTVSRPRAISLMRQCLDETGMRLGSSAAANWRTALDVAAELGEGATVVTVFPDAGSPSEWAEAGR